jgi:hypothetical protein
LTASLNSRGKKNQDWQKRSRGWKPGANVITLEIVLPRERLKSIKIFDSTLVSGWQW